MKKKVTSNKKKKKKDEVSEWCERTDKFYSFIWQ